MERNPDTNQAKEKLSLIKWFDRFPPRACRLVATKKHGWRGLSHSDISRISGIPRSTVADISKRWTWAGLSVDVIDKFSAACGVDLRRPYRSIDILRRRKNVFLHKGDKNQRLFFQRLLTDRGPA